MNVRLHEVCRLSKKIWTIRVLWAFKENLDNTCSLHYYVSRVDIFTYVSLYIYIYI